MIYECIYCLSNKLPYIIPVIISILAIGIAFYSWMTNSEPVIVFIWDNDYKCYYIKNVGKGPAMNITISYVNDTEPPTPPDWKNPVRCYSLEPNGKIYIDWGLKSGGILFSKENDKNMHPDNFLGGVTRLSAIYSSANFLIKQTYTSICEHDNTKIEKGKKVRQWTDNEVHRIWDLRRKTEDKEITE